MNAYQELVGGDGIDAEGDRHCAVCFAVIPKGAKVRRSLEGHWYCERCSKGFFKEVDLQGLRRDCCRLPREESIPA